MNSSNISFAFAQCVISFLFGGVSGLLSKVGTSEKCNHIDSILNLNLSNFLTGACIINLIFFVLSLIYYICKVTNFHILWTITYSHEFWSFVWFLFGTIILFGYNLDCIQESSISAISALFIWSTMMIHPTCL